MREFFASLFFWRLRPMTRLQLGDRDVLVVHVDQLLSDDAAARIRQHCINLLGEQQRVMVLPQGVTLSVLARPELATC
jgi:5-methylcytosine-specific restriction endonuclease McrBC regulatory subunit McrC